MDPVATDYGYEYFPIIEGRYIEYNVLFENYNSGVVDTSNYQIREEWSDIDSLTDEQQQQVRLYKRLNGDSDWELDSVWTQSINVQAAFRTERDIRFQRLEFPLFEGAEWDVNDFNVMSSNSAVVQSIDHNVIVNNQEFSSGMRISIDSFFTFVNRDYQYEKYAKGVGLIERYHEKLNFQPGKDTLGFRVHQSLSSYGQK